MTFQKNKIFPYPYSVIRLDNGLTAVIIPMECPGLVSYYTVVRTGSRDEWEKGKSGFAHFFEHMMFRGTERFPGHHYDRILTGLGAEANAYTTDDYTAFHLNFASEDLERVIELESDRFQNLKYTEQEFRTESGAVLGEYSKGKSNPWSVAFEKLHDMAFDVHTYKHTTIGTEEDIRNMPGLYEYSLDFFRKYYRPENTVIIAAGDVAEGNVAGLIKKYYSSWKTGYMPPEITPEPMQTSERFSEVGYHGKTLPLLLIAYKSDRFDLDNRHVISAVLLPEIIFGETSEIYKKLVLKEQKVQFIHADFGFSRDPKLLYIYTMIKNPNDIDYVRNEIYNTIKSYQESHIEQQRLEDLKKRERYSFLMHLNTPDHVAGFLAQFVSLTGCCEAVDMLYNRMNQITQQDILDAARYYFDPCKRNVILLREKQTRS